MYWVDMAGGNPMLGSGFCCMDSTKMLRLPFRKVTCVGWFPVLLFTNAEK
jgi:hypothetical protein